MSYEARPEPRPSGEPPAIQSGAGEACDVGFRSPCAFILCRDLDACAPLSSALLDVGIESEVFPDGMKFIDGLTRRLPDLVFVYVHDGATDAIDIMFALGRASYPGAVQLICACDEPAIEIITHMAQRLSLRTLPVLISPFGDAALVKILRAEGLPSETNSPGLDDLAEALQNGWMEFWYQPKIDLRKKHVVGVEALARVRHPQHGVLFPGAFLAGAAEKSLVCVDEQALISALTVSEDLTRMGVKLPLAVNVSIDGLRTLPILKIVQDFGPKAHKWPGLIIDVTEEQVADNIWLVSELITGLAQFGIKFAIDDYSGGRLSLAQLKQLPFTELKLSRTFVAGCDTDPIKAEICQAVINLVHGCGGRAVAMGVEKGSVAQALGRMGCDIGQGFLYGQPMPQEKFLALLRERASGRTGRA